MATFNKFNSFWTALAHKTHNLGSDTLKAMLTNVAPSASNTVKANITEISTGNGYSAGGTTVSITSSGDDGSGGYKLVLADTTITAAGGSIGPFRYAVVYNDTASNDELIGYTDYGSSITLADGESFIMDFDGSAGAVTIT